MLPLGGRAIETIQRSSQQLARVFPAIQTWSRALVLCCFYHIYLLFVAFFVTLTIILFILLLYFYVQLLFECVFSNQEDVFYSYLGLTWMILGGRERINWFSVISYGKNSFEIREILDTSMIQERINLVCKGSTV